MTSKSSSPSMLEKTENGPSTMSSIKDWYVSQLVDIDEHDIDDWNIGFHDTSPDHPFIGWLLPDGKAISTPEYNHRVVATNIGLTERELELMGWVKLTRGPAIPGTGTFFLKTYTVAHACNEPSKAQATWLKKIGFFFVENKQGVATYAFKPE